MIRWNELRTNHLSLGQSSVKAFASCKPKYILYDVAIESLISVGRCPIYVDDELNHTDYICCGCRQ
jgi:hypothetical protein